MIAYYLGIKHAHVALVLLSGSLFALRGLLAVCGRPQWARHTTLRYVSWSIDSLLLTAALMLLVVLKLNPFSTAWLATKLALLVAYIGFGTLALARDAVTWRRRTAYVLALCCFLAMLGVARAHDPLGPFASLLSTQAAEVSRPGLAFAGVRPRRVPHAGFRAPPTRAQ